MMLGGIKDTEGIKVTGAVPNQSFTAEGTFRVTSETGDALKKIKFYNLKAQVSADLTLSASEVSSFTLVLDILSDKNNKILDITDAGSAGGAGVSCSGFQCHAPSDRWRNCSGTHGKQAPCPRW